MFDRLRKGRDQKSENSLKDEKLVMLYFVTIV